MRAGLAVGMLLQGLQVAATAVVVVLHLNQAAHRHGQHANTNKIHFHYNLSAKINDFIETAKLFISFYISTLPKADCSAHLCGHDFDDKKSSK